MAIFSTRRRIVATFGAIEPLLLGSVLCLFFIGTINPSCLGGINSSLALKIAGGGWGGLVIAIALGFVMLACWAYAVEAQEEDREVSSSQLWSSFAACAVSTLSIKILGAASGFALVLGFFAVFSFYVREAMHLSMASSIAIVVVAGIVGLLSFAVLPQVALTIAERDRFGESVDKVVRDELHDTLTFSGPISAAVALVVKSIDCYEEQLLRKANALSEEQLLREANALRRAEVGIESPPGSIPAALVVNAASSAHSKRQLLQRVNVHTIPQQVA